MLISMYAYVCLLYYIFAVKSRCAGRRNAIEGVYPSLENIENGTYPLVTNVCVITRKDDPNPYVKKW